MADFTQQLSKWTTLWRDTEVGTLFADEEVGPGLRLKLRRGYTSVCAYFVIRADHPLVSLFPYSALPIDVHGGVTYGAAEGDQYLWGWDHGHLGDKMVPPLAVREKLIAAGCYSGNLAVFGVSETEWTPEMVWVEAQSAIREMRALMEVAEGRRATQAVASLDETL